MRSLHGVCDCRKPCLLGIAIEPNALAPQLLGLRMRGRVIVPAPAPTANFAPMPGGISPGP